MEKAKSRGNLLSFEVDQGVGDEIIGQQPHHTEGDELKKNGPFLGVKPEGYLFLLLRCPLKPLIFFQRVSCFLKRFVLSVPVGTNSCASDQSSSN